MDISIVQTILLSIILLLVGYIVFLQFKNRKMQSRIDSLIYDGNRENLLKSIEELDILKLKKKITGHQFLNEDVESFIFENEKESEIFLHYTKQEEIAKKIVSEGFKFSHSFHKTAENICNDKVDLLYKHHRHKHFGKYVVVISIDKKIYNFYMNETHKLSNALLVEQVLTEIPSYLDENQEIIYTLSNFYVKGYFNYETGKTITNPLFNSRYDSIKFRENIELFKKVVSNRS